MSIKDDNQALNERGVPAPFDQTAFVAEGIKELQARVAALPRSREQSIMLTKCDELRHWNEDLIKKEHYDAGGY